MFLLSASASTGITLAPAGCDARTVTAHVADCAFHFIAVTVEWRRTKGMMPNAFATVTSRHSRKQTDIPRGACLPLTTAVCVQGGALRNA